MTEKIYCGSARIISTNYGDMTKVSFHKEDINKIVKYMRDEKSDWCNLVVKEKREKTEGKPTHYLEIDTWKPDKPREEAPLPKSENTDEDLPF